MLEFYIIDWFTTQIGITYILKLKVSNNDFYKCMQKS